MGNLQNKFEQDHDVEVVSRKMLDAIADEIKSLRSQNNELLLKNRELESAAWFHKSQYEYEKKHCKYIRELMVKYRRLHIEKALD